MGVRGDLRGRSHYRDATITPPERGDPRGRSHNKEATISN